MIQVFQNIIGNAIKFSKTNPTVKIGYKLKENQHCITVKDYGIGIPEHLVRKTFNLFTRLNDKGAFPGSGIGLALCKKIIDFHKGKIQIIPCDPGVEVVILLPNSSV